MHNDWRTQKLFFSPTKRSVVIRTVFQHKTRNFFYQAIHFIWYLLKQINHMILCEIFHNLCISLNVCFSTKTLNFSFACRRVVRAFLFSTNYSNDYKKWRNSLRIKRIIIGFLHSNHNLLFVVLSSEYSKHQNKPIQLQAIVWKYWKRRDISITGKQQNKLFSVQATSNEQTRQFNK